MKKTSLFISILVFSFFISALSLQARSKSTVKTYLVEPNFIRLQGNSYVFSPNSNVKKTSYSYYYFSAKKLKKLLRKDPKAGSFYISFKILKTKKNRYVPKDPRMQQPIGGFRITKHYCRVIKARPIILKHFSILPNNGNKSSGKLKVKRGKLIYIPFLKGKAQSSKIAKRYVFSLKEVKKQIKKDPTKVDTLVLKFEITHQRTRRSRSKSRTVRTYYCKLISGYSL